MAGADGGGGHPDRRVVAVTEEPPWPAPRLDWARLLDDLRAASRQAGIRSDDPLWPVIETLGRTAHHLAERSAEIEATSERVLAGLDGLLERGRAVSFAEVERIRAELARTQTVMVAEVAGAIGDAANRTLVRRVMIHDLRLAAWSVVVFVTVLLGVSAGSYALGAVHVRERYVSADASVRSILAAGGVAAAERWRDLMGWNDIVEAEAICVRIGNTAQINGRAACAIPLWTEPPPAAR